MSRDWCDFFKKIQTDPFNKIKDFKVRDLFLAREHLAECNKCDRMVNKILDSNPESDQDGISISLN